MAARQRPSVVKSHELIRRPAEKMKASVQEYIASTRTRIEFSCLKLPISSVLRRVTKEKLVIPMESSHTWTTVVERLVNLLSIPDTIQRPINDTKE